jgi:peroxiredoxin
MRALRIAASLTLFAALAGAGIAAAESPAIGSAAPDFQLTSVDGKAFSLADAAKSHKATVVMFIATKCPYSNAYNDRMKKMADEYAARGVQFVGINSNVSEPADEVQKHGKEHGFAFPLMKDPGNKVADMYDAKRTPEVFVVDAQGKVRYHGRIDENYEDASKVTSPDLRNALDALLAGQQVKNTETKAFGCTIKRA